MKTGQSILGFRLISNGTVSSGRCMWAFAERDGKMYFVKQFVTPKYPVEGAPGSAAKKGEALKRCQVFERSQKRIMDAIRHKVASGGSLVAPVDFGRSGTMYYKIYDRIDVSNLSPATIAAMTAEAKSLILRVVSHSVSILHKERIVHGDMKPANILIKKTETGAYTAKLIDFDDSYFEGEPPEDAELVIGDPAYYSPELLDYVITNDLAKRPTITTKSDIFAMGLIFTEYWTGKLPEYDRTKFSDPAAAVLAGAPLNLRGLSVPDDIADLVRLMLERDPHKRPSATEVLAELKTRTGVAPPKDVRTDAPVEVVETGSRLRGKRPPAFPADLPGKPSGPSVTTASRLLSGKTKL